MNNVYKINQKDSMDGASEWLIKLDRGLTADEQTALNDWLTDKSNKSALIQVAELWDDMESLSRLADLFPQPTLSATPDRKTRSRHFSVAIAASIVISVAIGFLGWTNIDSKFEPSANTENIAGYQEVFETAVGESSTVNLPDGSVITLNTATRVSVKFDENKRYLKLDHGEIYVKVYKDNLRPFDVQAFKRVVRAVGTEFNVEIKDKNLIELIVAEGKVLVGVVKQPSSLGANVATPDFLSNQQGLPVLAGEKILLSDLGQALEQIDNKEIEVKLSWRGGNLVFKGEPLERALEEVARYTPVEFIIMDESLKTIRIGGLFKSGDVEGLLKALRQNFNIAYERVGDKMIMLTYSE